MKQSKEEFIKSEGADFPGKNICGLCITTCISFSKKLLIERYVSSA